ncbi:MAG: hypothetical protein ABIU54_07845, partial [Candidatus Eisenbacteria bacterium]
MRQQSRPRRWRVVAGLLGVVGVIVGCGKSPTTPTTPGVPTGTIADLTAMISRAYPAGSQLPSTLDTTANILAGINVDGLRASVAVFPVLSGGFLILSDAGVVTVRTGLGSTKTATAFDKLQLNVNGTIQTVFTTLVSHPLDLALAFDGSTYHSFTVSGTAAVPALVDSVKSVSLPALSAPSAGASVSRSTSLPVSWSDAGADTTVYMMVFVGSQVDTSKYAVAPLVRDLAGSASVPTAQLSLLPNGAARMTVVRFRLMRRNLGGRK